MTMSNGHLIHAGPWGLEFKLFFFCSNASFPSRVHSSRSSKLPMTSSSTRPVESMRAMELYSFIAAYPLSPNRNLKLWLWISLDLYVLKIHITNLVAMASIAAAVSVPTFSGLKAETKAAPAAKVSSTTVVRMAPVRASASSDTLRTVGKALIAASSSLLLVAGANAATVKMGGDDGTLGFYPNSLSVSAGEAITFINNKGFPHNVVFDEDAIPAGVKVDDLNHEDYLNAPAESFSITLKTPGTYGYYCEPHQGAGMKGTITVS